MSTGDGSVFRKESAQVPEVSLYEETQRWLAARAGLLTEGAYAAKNCALLEQHVSTHSNVSFLFSRKRSCVTVLVMHSFRN